MLNIHLEILTYGGVQVAVGCGALGGGGGAAAHRSSGAHIPCGALAIAPENNTENGDLFYLRVPGCAALPITAKAPPSPSHAPALSTALRSVLHPETRR